MANIVSELRDQNTEQKLKNESDMILLLLNQLDNEIGSFYYTYSYNNPDDVFRMEEATFKGIEGLNNFALRLSTKNFSRSNFSFKDDFACDQILLMVRSFKLIHNRIKMAALSKGLREVFLNKLKSFYECRLEFPLSKIDEALFKVDWESDLKAKEILEFTRNIIYYLSLDLP